MNLLSCIGATVTVHQFFCILHFCHTCSLCRVELVVQFPARGSTQVLLHVSLLPGVLCCDTSYILTVHIQCQASIYTLSLCRGHSWRVRLDKLRLGYCFTPYQRIWLYNGAPLVAFYDTLPGTWSHLWFAGIRECLPWCSIVGATVTVHQFFCILHIYTFLAPFDECHMNPQ